MSMAYIAKKSCGCMVAACVDNPEHKKDTAKFISGIIKDGLTIERVTVEYCRQNLKRCECKVTQQSKAEELFHPGVR